jgi:hypothetical protein
VTVRAPAGVKPDVRFGGQRVAFTCETRR